MCGRYVRKSDKQRLGDAFRVGNLTDLPLDVAPNYCIAPTTRQPVVRNSRDTGERDMVAMRWGMVPHFSKSLADFSGFSTINAKAETLMSKAMWRLPFQRRCLVPADGFMSGNRSTRRRSSPLRSC
jgi:putative SOS response-associated peptidase YedK